MNLEASIGMIASTLSWVIVLGLVLLLFIVAILSLSLLILKIGRWFTARIKYAWHEPEQNILSNKIFKSMNDEDLHQQEQEETK